MQEYGRTYDPRLLPADPVVPFKPYARQVEFLRWLQERYAAPEDGLAEKSRDVGLSWLCVAFAVHGWLFYPGFACGFGSRKAEYVDAIGNMRAMLEKVRFMLRYLPQWMLPDGYQERKHAVLNKIVNPETKASITGESGDEIGRGDRTRVYFIDEAAHLEHPDKAELSLSRTTDCRIWVGTPNGPGNPFYRKRFGGALNVFTFHWRDDPRKSQEWYDAECKRLGDPVVVAQELDIDYTASLSGILLPAAWVRAATGIPLVWSDGTAFEARGPKIAGLDIGESSNTFLVRQGPAVSPVTQWAGDVRNAVSRARQLAVEAGCEVIHYDADGPGHDVDQILRETADPGTVRFVPVHGGHGASDALTEDGRRACEVYHNIRAEAWWAVRRRLRLAWECKEQGVYHPPDEMLCLPADPQLSVELSVPLIVPTETGKLRVEPKTGMAARGVASPHRADALALTFAPLPVPVVSSHTAAGRGVGVSKLPY